MAIPTRSISPATGSSAAPDAATVGASAAPSAVVMLAAAFAIGLLFGLGLVISGLSSPTKVLAFLDVAGAFDPSLAFVMAGAVATTAIGYRLVFARGRPLFAARFQVPTATDLDARLIGGAALFGLGWGLVGYCPGPALTALGVAGLPAVLFVAAMLAGMVAARAFGSAGASGRPDTRDVAPASNPSPGAPRTRGSNLAPPGGLAMTTHPTKGSVTSPDVTGFYDADTATISYVVKDPASSACAVIDSVMDIDYASGRISHASADRIIAHVRERGLKVEWLIETHAHADHLSAAPYIQERVGGKLGIGEHIVGVQDVFGKVFNEGTEFRRDGSQFDRLFKDGDTYTIGGLTARVIHTPGHTPACTTHVIGDAAFVGDTLFMPDGGTARADFPGGDARTLFRSIRMLLETLPPETRLFMCHDYAPGGREIRWETTVAEERAHNIHVRDGVSEDAFVALREARDRTLDMPRLIIPSLQVNIRAGHLPEPDDNGKRYLKVPINGL